MIEGLIDLLTGLAFLALWLWPVTLALLIAAGIGCWIAVRRHSWVVLVPGKRVAIAAAVICLPVLWASGVFESTEPLPPPKEESARSFASDSTATLTIKAADGGDVPFFAENTVLLLTYLPTDEGAWGVTHTYYKGRCGFILTTRCKQTDVVARVVKLSDELRLLGPSIWEVRVAEALLGRGAYALTDIKVIPCHAAQCTDEQKQRSSMSASVVSSTSTGLPQSLLLAGSTPRESILISYSGRGLQLQIPAWMLPPDQQGRQKSLPRGLATQFMPASPLAAPPGNPALVHNRGTDSGYSVYWKESGGWRMDPANFDRPFSQCGPEGFPDRATTIRTQYTPSTPVPGTGTTEGVSVAVWSDESTRAVYVVRVDKADADGSALETSRYYFCEGRFLGTRRMRKSKHEEQFTWRFLDGVPHEYLHLGFRDDGNWYENFWNRIGEEAWPHWFTYKPDWNEFNARHEEAKQLLIAVGWRKWPTTSVKKMGE